MGIKGHWGCAGLLLCYMPHRAMTFRSELLSYGRATIPFKVRVSHAASKAGVYKRVLPYKRMANEWKCIESPHTGSATMIGFMCGVPWIYGLSDGLVIIFAALFYVPVTAGMNGFLKAEFSNMWTATLQNKKSFKRPISKFFFFPSLKLPSLAANEGQLYFILDCLVLLSHVLIITFLPVLLFPGIIMLRERWGV